MKTHSPKFIATVTPGGLVFQDRAALRRFVLSFPEGSEVWVTIEKRGKARTLRQNAYYWGAVLPTIAASTGHSVMELHEIFKRRFLPPTIVVYRGEEVAIRPSTTETNTVEFTDYIERIRAEALELGVVIPSPSQAFDMRPDACYIGDMEDSGKRETDAPGTPGTILS